MKIEPSDEDELSPGEDFGDWNVPVFASIPRRVSRVTQACFVRPCATKSYHRTEQSGYTHFSCHDAIAFARVKFRVDCPHRAPCNVFQMKRAI